MTSEDLARLLVAIAACDHSVVTASLDAAPGLATARFARGDEFFIAECHAQVYEGDTALHAAALAYDIELARDLVARGGDVRARNRRGAVYLQRLHVDRPRWPLIKPTKENRNGKDSRKRKRHARRSRPGPGR